MARPPARTRLARRRATVAAASLATVVTLCAACSSSGPTAVSASDLQSHIATQWAAQVHRSLPSVACPGPLAARVGATIMCNLAPQGSRDRFEVTVRVGSVQGSRVNFSAEVDQTPIGVTTTTP